MDYVHFYLGEAPDSYGRMLPDLWQHVLNKDINIPFSILFPLESDMKDEDWDIFMSDFAIKKNLTRSVICSIINCDLEISHEDFGQSVLIFEKHDIDWLSWQEDKIKNLVELGKRICNYGFIEYCLAIKDFLLDKHMEEKINLSNKVIDEINDW